MTHADLASWGELCGWTLARAHARSGDPVAIDGYLGDAAGEAMAHAMVAFAARYADQTERDHATLTIAIKQGRVVAEHEGS